MWKNLVGVMLLIAGCATNTDVETVKVEAANNNQSLLNTVMKLQTRVSALEAGVADTKSHLNQLLNEQRTATEAAKVRPTADALALLLKPNAVGLTEMKTTGDERLWDVDSGLVPGCSMVVLGRMKNNPSAWHIGLSGKLEVSAFGIVEKVCGNRPIFYKITGGPLAGAFIEDQIQEQFIIASPAWMRAKFAGSCSDSFL